MATKGEGTGLRLSSIQFLRGVAAFLVLLFHAFYIISISASSAGVPGPGTRFTDGAVGVDLFFVISGFVMALTIRHVNGWSGVADFLLKRFIRLAPLFYVIGAAASLIAAARGTPFSWERMATGLTILPIGGSYSPAPLHQGWTLAFEAAFYLLVATAVLIAPSRRYTTLLAILVALSMLPLGRPVDFATGRFFFNGILLEFAFGVAVYLLWQGGHLARLWAVTFAAALAGAVLLSMQLATGFQHGSLMAVVNDVTSLRRAVDWGLPCAVVLAGLLLWRPSDSLMSRAGQKLGEISYSLYLVHILVIDALVPALVGRTPPAAAVAVCLIASIAAALAVHRFVESPLLHMMRGSAAIRMIGKTNVIARQAR